MDCTYVFLKTTHQRACLVAQSCPTLCDPMDCSPSGSSDRGITKARILEFVAISFTVHTGSLYSTLAASKELF